MIYFITIYRIVQRDKSLHYFSVIKLLKIKLKLYYTYIIMFPYLFLVIKSVVSHLPVVVVYVRG